MMWEVIRIIGRNIKRLVCPFVIKCDDEWCCKKKKAMFHGYYECNGYCPKKIRGDNNG